MSILLSKGFDSQVNFENVKHSSIKIVLVACGEPLKRTIAVFCFYFFSSLKGFDRPVNFENGKHFSVKIVFLACAETNDRSYFFSSLQLLPTSHKNNVYAEMFNIFEITGR